MAAAAPRPAPGVIAPLAASRPVQDPQTLTWQWLLDFLRRELAPYPGRASAVARMTIAATLVMLAIMTFHIPGGALGGYYALVITRENLRSTLHQATLSILAFLAGTLYTVLGILLFVDSPVTHFLWVIGSLYLIFFVMGTVRNYGVAAGFSFLIATAIPLWDRPGPVELKLYATLWTLLSVALGCAAALLVEAIYHSSHPADSVVSGLVERLQCVESTLRTYARGQPLTGRARSRLQQYAMVGPASLRRAVIRTGQAPQMRAQIAAFISLTGRLVDLSIHLEQGLRTPASNQPPADDARRLAALADTLSREWRALAPLRTMEDATRLALPPWQGSASPETTVPLLPVLEQTVSMLRSIFSPPLEQRRRERSLLALGDKPQPSGLFVPDAFTNRDHLVFAFRGCLAATFCYVLYNAIDWPGINTAVATCIITALGTIGSSRQKQVLRVSGAIVGGLVISLPAQIYLLPLMDSISAFTLYFAAVSALAAWFATSSPRLSYLGLQIALAFYLINLQEFTVQTSLTVARDRVIGVLLGLFAMWLVFDQLWAPRAADRMRVLLAQNLRALGRMARLAALIDTGAEAAAREAVLHVRALREKINGDLSQMNEQADAVEFEVGAARRARLRSRSRMQAMQPAMRTIFLLEIALAQYRSTLEAGTAGRRTAFSRFQHACAEHLAAIAARVEQPLSSSPPATLLQQVEQTLVELTHQERQDLAGLTICRQIAAALQALGLAQEQASLMLHASAMTRKPDARNPTLALE
ncbi:MAG TPA: FUSC family protein [Acidobacteriaceae bacterium]